MTPTPTPPTARAVSEVLEAAALLIKPEGKWTQRAFARDASGQVPGSYNNWPVLPIVSRCLTSALSQASCRDCTQYVRRMGFRTAGEAIRWNDAPERTQAEVIAALRSAATLARETEARS